MNVAITGATGLVGSQVSTILQKHHAIIPFSSSDLDITNREAVFNTLNKSDFDLLVHLAGYTKVDNAETEKQKAFDINVKGTRNVFDAVVNKNKKMMYVSTDFVFPGEDIPYNEESIPNPVGYYGQTKFEGEQIVKNKAMIIRISYPYLPILSSSPKGGSQKPDFVHRLQTLLEEGRELHMITNGSMTPTHIDDIAYSINHLITSYTPEIFHIVGSETLSPYDLAMRVCEKYELNSDLIKKTTYEEFMKGRAKRPQYSQMVSKKNSFQPMRAFLRF